MSDETYADFIGGWVDVLDDYLWELDEDDPDEKLSVKTAGMVHSSALRRKGGDNAVVLWWPCSATELLAPLLSQDRVSGHWFDEVGLVVASSAQWVFAQQMDDVNREDPQSSEHKQLAIF